MASKGNGHDVPDPMPRMGNMVQIHDKKLVGTLPALVTRVREEGCVDLVLFWAGVRPRTVPCIARLNIPFTSNPPDPDDDFVRPETTMWSYIPE